MEKKLRKNDNKRNKKKTIANINGVRFMKVEDSSFVHTSYFRQSNQSRLNRRGTCFDGRKAKQSFNFDRTLSN